MKKIFFALLGLILLPIVAVTFESFFFSISRIQKIDSGFWYFLAGAGIFVLLSRWGFLKRLYVFSHEWSHALFSWVMGGKIRKIKVTERSGWARVTFTNFLVELAPYFFPLLAVFFSLLYFISIVLKPSFKVYQQIYFGALGFSLLLHFQGNYQALKIKQSDLASKGRFFSLIFISWVNVLFLFFFVKLVFWKTVSLTVFFRRIVFGLQKAWQYVNMFNN